MIPSRGAELAEGSLHLDDHGGHPHFNHERSPLIGSELFHSPLSEEEEDENHAREVSSWNRLPWWKRPSPYWVIFGVSFGSIGYSALLAPKVALYTTLACRVHRPDHVGNNPIMTFPLTHNSATANVTDVPFPHVSDSSQTAVDTVSVLLPNSVYTASPGYAQHESEPDSQQKCASDPVVQAVVARLNAVFMTGMGILTCLTSGWWGSLSDRSGRRIVVFASTFGLLINDIVHVITAWFVDVLPGGYWFPLVGFFIEGLCGSMSTKAAVTHAYLADTTEPSTRSRYFSLSLGLMFVGGAVGPVLGGLLIRSTGSLMSVFYFASILHALHAIFVLSILPESLTVSRARRARLGHEQQKASQVPSGRALDVLKIVTSFLSPLVVLLPERSLDADPLKRGRKDWNLLFVAMAYGLVMSIFGSFSYKFQYAAAQFNWTAEETSYYISAVSAARGTFLAVVLPLIIKYFKPSPIQLPSSPDERLQSATRPSPSSGASSSPLSPPTQALASDECLPSSRSSTFDLVLARISAGLETVTFLGMAVASTGTLFTLASIIDSFTSGFYPVSQALALDIYTNRRSQNRGEAGKLFGALSVMQALGPALYGFVYFNTVAFFPQAIMIVSMCTTLLALTFVSFVRISFKPSSGHGNEGDQAVEPPEILVAIES